MTEAAANKSAEDEAANQPKMSKWFNPDRFRNRGGIFKPTPENPMIAALLSIVSSGSKASSNDNEQSKGKTAGKGEKGTGGRKSASKKSITGKRQKTPAKAGSATKTRESLDRSEQQDNADPTPSTSKSKSHSKPVSKPTSTKRTRLPEEKSEHGIPPDTEKAAKRRKQAESVAEAEDAFDDISFKPTSSTSKKNSKSSTKSKGRAGASTSSLTKKPSSSKAKAEALNDLDDDLVEPRKKSSGKRARQQLSSIERDPEDEEGGNDLEHVDLGHKRRRLSPVMEEEQRPKAPVGKGRKAAKRKNTGAEGDGDYEPDQIRKTKKPPRNRIHRPDKDEDDDDEFKPHQISRASPKRKKRPLGLAKKTKPGSKKLALVSDEDGERTEGEEEMKAKPGRSVTLDATDPATKSSRHKIDDLSDTSELDVGPSQGAPKTQAVGAKSGSTSRNLPSTSKTLKVKPPGKAASSKEVGSKAYDEGPAKENIRKKASSSTLATLAATSTLETVISHSKSSNAVDHGETDDEDDLALTRPIPTHTSSVVKGKGNEPGQSYEKHSKFASSSKVAKTTKPLIKTTTGTGKAQRQLPVVPKSVISNLKQQIPLSHWENHEDSDADPLDLFR